MIELCGVGSAVLWIVSSIFWVWSALAANPLDQMKPGEPFSVQEKDLVMNGVSWVAVGQFFRKQSHINACAAGTSAVAALLAAIVAIAPAIGWIAPSCCPAG